MITTEANKMVSFIDGPAEGVRLGCIRAPLFLRVCRNRRTGGWDACDQLTDRPREEEEVHVYRLVEKPSSAFVCTRGGAGRGGGGPQQIGRYQVAEERPSDEVVRNNARWAEWCHDPRRVVPEWMRTGADRTSGT